MAIITTPPAESTLITVAKDDRTPLGLFLPDEGNSARIDARRLRASLIILNALLSDVISETEVRLIVSEAVASLVDSSPTALDTLNELAAALGDDPNFATTIAGQIGTKADKDSPTLTGTPRSTTFAAASNSTAIATTAFVHLLLQSGADRGANWTVPTAVVDDNDTSPASTAFVLAQAATGVLLRALTSTTRFLTPKAMADGMALVTEAATATITPNFSLGFNRLYTMALNATLGQPTGMVDGLPVVAYFQQDATGGRTISFNSTYNKFPGGSVPTLSTAANVVDRLAGICRSRSGTLVVEWGSLEQDIR